LIVIVLKYLPENAAVNQKRNFCKKQQQTRHQMFTTQNRKKDETLKTLIKEIKTLKK
jgi:hypothetical protein